MREDDKRRWLNIHGSNQIVAWNKEARSKSEEWEVCGMSAHPILHVILAAAVVVIVVLIVVLVTLLPDMLL